MDVEKSETENEAISAEVNEDGSAVGKDVSVSEEEVIGEVSTIVESMSKEEVASLTVKVLRGQLIEKFGEEAVVPHKAAIKEALITAVTNVVNDGDEKDGSDEDEEEDDDGPEYETIEVPDIPEVEAMSDEYKEMFGKLVWARGNSKWPFWPAIVYNPSALKRDFAEQALKHVVKGKFVIRYYGLPSGSAWGFVTKSNLQEYTENNEKNEKQKIAKKDQARFKSGIEEIKVDLEKTLEERREWIFPRTKTVKKRKRKAKSIVISSVNKKKVKENSNSEVKVKATKGKAKKGKTEKKGGITPFVDDGEEEPEQEYVSRFKSLDNTLQSKDDELDFLNDPLSEDDDNDDDDDYDAKDTVADKSKEKKEKTEKAKPKPKPKSTKPKAKPKAARILPPTLTAEQKQAKLSSETRTERCKRLAGLVQAYADKNDSVKVLSCLNKLETMNLTPQELKEGDCGKPVKKLKKHTNEAIKSAAGALMNKWLAMLQLMSKPITKEDMPPPVPTSTSAPSEAAVSSSEEVNGTSTAEAPVSPSRKRKIVDDEDEDDENEKTAPAEISAETELGAVPVDIKDNQRRFRMVKMLFKCLESTDLSLRIEAAIAQMLDPESPEYMVKVNSLLLLLKEVPVVVNKLKAAADDTTVEAIAKAETKQDLLDV
jgi:hypothetical protein